MSFLNTNVVTAEVRAPLSIPIITRPVKIQKMAKALETFAFGTLSPYLVAIKVIKLDNTNCLLMESTKEAVQKNSPYLSQSLA